MKDHPITGFVAGALENIKNMVDVNTIVGEPVETPDGSTIIPISRVSFGFGAGGTDYAPKGMVLGTSDNGTNGLFGGGVGAGVTINPMGFLVIGQGQIKFIPMSAGGGTVDKLVDYIPFAFEKINSFIKNVKSKDAKDAVEKNE